MTNWANAALRFLEAKLSDIKVVVPADKREEAAIGRDRARPDARQARADAVPPDAGWLKSNGYSDRPGKCVHLPRAADLRHEAQHQRATVGDPARTRPRLSRSGARLRRTADQGGLREVQEERPRRQDAALQRQPREALRPDEPEGVLRRDDGGVLRRRTTSSRSTAPS